MIKNLISGISFLCLIAVLFLVLCLGVIRTIRGRQGEGFSYQGVDRLPICFIKTFPVTSYLIRVIPIILGLHIGRLFIDNNWPCPSQSDGINPVFLI